MHGLQSSPGQAERVHRHATRVRRVACERIGAERLHAYCERVKEAFEAYMHGSWHHPMPKPTTLSDDVLLADDGEEVENAERGRRKEKGDGSVLREEKPETNKLVATLVKEEVDDGLDADTVMEDDDRMGLGLGLGLGSGLGLDMDLRLGDEGDMLRIDLDDVQETDETNFSSSEGEDAR